VEVIDVPGTYTLDPTSRAEEVAVQMLEEAGPDDVIINVVDATRLERNLNLTLQLLERDVPAIMALNMWDDARHKGIDIDVQKLEELLSIPIVPTVAVSGQGIHELVSRIPEATVHNMEPHDVEDRWGHIGSLVTQVQRIAHRHHTFLDRFGGTEYQAYQRLAHSCCGSVDSLQSNKVYGRRTHWICIRSSLHEIVRAADDETEHFAWRRRSFA